MSTAVEKFFSAWAEQDAAGQITQMVGFVGVTDAAPE